MRKNKFKLGRKRVSADRFFRYLRHCKAKKKNPQKVEAERIARVEAYKNSLNKS